jgi:hypothetical protein
VTDYPGKEPSPSEGGDQAKYKNLDLVCRGTQPLST